MNDMTTIGVHRSVQSVFPPMALSKLLSGVVQSAPIVESKTNDLSSLDGLVTLEYSPTFLEARIPWIHSIQSGVDRFPLDTLVKSDVVLTNSTGIHQDVVGDMCLAYMLMFCRYIDVYTRNQVVHHWESPPWNEPIGLSETSVCVVGLGTLGRGIAKKASALDIDVVGVRKTPEAVDHVQTVYPPDGLHDAINDVTFVALAVPYTDETENLMGDAEFTAMGDDSFIINVSRGGVVDERALIDALNTQTIKGAALDVFEEEPLPAESPLWEMDRVIITPHAAGNFSEYYRAVGDIITENIERWESDQPLTNRVC